MSAGRWFRHLRGWAFAGARGDAAAALRHRRELALLALDGDADLVTFRRDGLEWTTTAVRHTITRNLYVHGRHPRSEVGELADRLRADGGLGRDRPWAVDVGANLGSPTLFFARDLGRRVLAIEPVPENFALLSRNVARNGFSGLVTCVCAAVAETPGTVPMLRPAKDGQCEVGSDAAARRLSADGGVGTVEVPARRLDEIVASHGIRPEQVAFVWSDTQGFETDVVRSGTPLWDGGVPLFVEVWPEGLEAHHGIAAFCGAVRSAFRGFVPSHELLARGAARAPRAVGEFETWVRSLRKQTDALLLR